MAWDIRSKKHDSRANGSGYLLEKKLLTIQATGAYLFKDKF